MHGIPTSCEEPAGQCLPTHPDTQTQTQTHALTHTQTHTHGAHHGPVDEELVDVHLGFQAHHLRLRPWPLMVKGSADG